MTDQQLAKFNEGKTGYLYGDFYAGRYETGTQDGEYYCLGMMYQFAKRLISWPQAKVYYKR